MLRSISMLGCSDSFAVYRRMSDGYVGIRKYDEFMGRKGAFECVPRDELTALFRPGAREA